MRTILLLTLLMQSVSGSGTETDVDLKLERFKALPGPEQVAVVFHERFQGRSLLFWKRSSEVWLTAADSRFSFEQDILIGSNDVSINDALVREIEGNNAERVRYATFLLCLRARFVPHSDFLIQQIVGSDLMATRDGAVSPFPPDWSRLNQGAMTAIHNVLASPNPILRHSAQIYTFATFQALSNVPTSALVEQWRAASQKVPFCFQDRPTAYSDPEQLLPLLRAALASRGLEAAAAVSSLLKNELNAETRGEEIEFVRLVDATVIRLRASQKGRTAIQAVKDAVLSHPLDYCGMRLNKTVEDRQKYWLNLEDQFLRDKFCCDLNWWTILVPVAFDLLDGDHLTVPSADVKNFRVCNNVCNAQMRSFMSWLTEIDPTFPAWEYAGEGTYRDMLHPRFVAKIRRYHEMWLKMNAAK